VLIVKERDAVIGAEDFVDRVAVEKTPIHDRDARVGRTRDGAVDIRHAFKSVHERSPPPSAVRVREQVPGWLGVKGKTYFDDLSIGIVAIDPVVSDTDCLNEETPVITKGLRGIVYYEIKVKTLINDVHSGIYGGNVLNPANTLSHIISSLKDESGHIKIPNIYNNVRKYSNNPFRFAIINRTGGNQGEL